MHKSKLSQNFYTIGRNNELKKSSSNLTELNSGKLKWRKYTKTFSSNVSTAEFNVEDAKQIISVIPDGFDYGLFAGVNGTHLYLRAVSITTSPITFAYGKSVTFTVYYV